MAVEQKTQQKVMTTWIMIQESVSRVWIVGGGYNSEL